MNGRILIIFLFFICLPAWGQTELTTRANLMRGSDTVRYQSADFYVPVLSEDGIWDLRPIKAYHSDHLVYFSSDSLSYLHKYEDRSRTSYLLDNDTLKQYQYEDRLMKITYADKKISMKFPFHVGDSLSSCFDGYGTYCGNHEVIVKGQVIIQAGNYGRLVLSDNDTLNNVLEIRTLTTTAMAMDVSCPVFDATNLKQEIEEKYEWYCQGFRYPVYTSVQRTSYSNLKPVGSTQLAFRLLPGDFTNLKDNFDDSIRIDRTVKDSQKETSEEIFHYNIILNNNGININYTIDKDAMVLVLLADCRGILYKNSKYSIRGGDAGNISMGTLGLRPGQYILYINVNGRIYSRTINLR